ncbi:MAG: bifunctional phosphopantothenoylcysteine decarboxylase/phosphopantothenate--cysteine ligase CoaBC [Candidatus Muiribacteriota bacterium]
MSLKNFKNKKILVCITGGIGASKVPALLSLLRKNKAEIKIVMTENAKKFITPLTCQAISGASVYTSMWEDKRDDINHISLKDFPDLTIVVPATANIIGKFTSAIADDLLSTTLLGIKTPVLFVPAMNKDMWQNPFFQKKLKKLIKNGYYYMQPSSGFLACGEEGKGRMPEPLHILNFAYKNFFLKNTLSAQKVLITLGSTREWFDDVRFISNPSSGKMGKFISKEFINRGAEVTIIAGKHSVELPEEARVIEVDTACEMEREVFSNIKGKTVFISAAAVCDFRPDKKFKGKIKKVNKEKEIVQLVKNPDILKKVGIKYKNSILLCGFAAETENHEKNALKKLKDKNLNMLLLNDVSGEETGFESDFNEMTIFTEKDKKILKKDSKQNIAGKIVDFISSKFL